MPARLCFENTLYVNNPYHNNNTNIHRQINPGVFIYLEHYDNTVNTGYRFTLEKINGQVFTWLMADYNSDSGKRLWHLLVFIRTITAEGTQKMQFRTNLDTTLNFLPSEFIERLNDVEAMNHKELDEFIDQQRMQGSTNILYYQVEKYKRTAFPFATFVLTLIGVALSSRKVRGGTGLHLGIGLVIAFSFILFMQVSTTFAEGGLISPAIAVWIPNVIYGVLAFFMLRTAPK